MTAVPMGRGPTADQIAVASRLPAGEQKQMISGMVDGLAKRLKEDPQDREGWARLIRARMVQGEPAAAKAALADALRAFKTAPADQAYLRQSAKASGVPGA